MKKDNIKVVTIGGGTGSFTLLTELKELPNIEVTAVVAMSDSGGSTGRLRVDMGVLPAGDVRQALVALSRSPEQLRELFTYRYTVGDMRGHSFGNIFLSTLEKVAGSFEQAILQAGKLLNVRGRIYPVTLHKHELVVQMNNGERIVGEGNIDNRFVSGYMRMYLTNAPILNPNVAKAIADADVVIIAPGNFYCSIVPNFLVNGLTEVLNASNARTIMITNLLSKEGHTTGFSVAQFLYELRELSGGSVDGFVPDTVVYNIDTEVTPELERVYTSEGGELVALGSKEQLAPFKGVEFIGDTLIAQDFVKKQDDTDIVQRALLRHNAKRVLELVGLYK